MKKPNQCGIESVSQPNEDGFVTIEMYIGDHGCAVEVIGKGYDEAVDRAVTIRDAFEKKPVRL